MRVDVAATAAAIPTRAARLRDQLALGREASAATAASSSREPAHVLELVVVAVEVAAGRLHQEVVDGLVDALPSWMKK